MSEPQASKPIAELVPTRDELEARLEERTAGLRAACEELRVVDEELRQQNEELIASRSQVEAERARYQELFDLAPDGYVVTDLGGDIQEANRAASELLGVASEHLVGKPLGIYVLEAERSRYVAELGSLKTGKPRASWETRLQPRGAEPFPAAVTAAVAHNAAGESAGLRWLIRDITEQKRGEEQIASLARFPDENPNPVLRLAHDGTILYSNGSGSVLLGEWSRKVGEIAPPDWQQTVQEALRTGNEQVRDVKCGERIYLVSVAPILEGGYVNLYGRDVTSERESQKALQQAHDELELRVEERTAELLQTNERLQEKIEENIRTEQSLRLEEARLDALLRLSQISQAPLSEIAAFVLEQGIALTRSKIGFVGFLSEDESIYTLYAVSREVVKECNVSGEPLQWHVAGAGIWAEAIRQRKTLFMNDYSQPHPQKKGFPPGHPYVEKFMVVPILEGGRAVAVAGVGNKASDYDSSDERQIALLLGGMWDRVQQGRAREALQKAHDELEERVKERTAQLAELNAALREEIAERKQAEEALRASEERLQRAQEIAHLGSWELNLVNNQLTWSDEVYRIFGLQPQGFGATYEAFLEHVHPDDRSAVDAAYSGSLRDGCDGYEIEHRVVRHSTGEIRMVHEKCEHVRDAADEIVRSVGMVHDITERKRAEEALRETEERFRSVLENSLDAAYRRNLQTDRYDYMSPVFEQIAGWTVEEMNSAGIEEVLAKIHPDDLPEVQKEIDRTWTACEAGQPATGTLEYRFRAKDGTYRWLGDHISVLADSAGRALYRLGIVRDITERKRRDEELGRLNRTLTAHNHSNRALLHAMTEAEYMREVCQIIVEDCGHAMVWIGFAEDDEGKTISPVAYAGFEEGYLETLNLTWADTERGRGPTGTAIRTGQPSFCRSMLTDPQFAPWREEALRRGYASSLVLPLLDNGRAFGALTIYFREPDPFTEDEVALLAGLADDLSYGIRTIRLRDAHAQAAEALRQSEERYRHLFNSMTEGFGLHEIVCDVDGAPYDYRFLEINPAFETLTGLKKENLIGRTVLEVLPATEPFWIETYGRVALTGEPTHFEHYSTALDRTYEVFSFRPAEKQFAALFLDISARKRAEEALQRAHDELELRVQERTAELEASEERFRQLAENIQEIFWMLEPDTQRLLYVSPAYDAIWGRSREELYKEPRSILDSIHPDDLQQVLQGFTPDWRAYDGEFRIIRPDGTTRCIRIRSFPIRNEQGEIYRLAGVATDVTQQKAAAATLIQTERLAMAGKMAASLVHEINNPLQAVIGCLGLAKGSLESGGDPSNYVRIAHQEVQRTARIVSQLRSLARPIQSVQKEPTDLNLLVSDVLTLNKKQLESKRIEAIWEPDEELPSLTVTSDAMRQVFLNLVFNAIDAMPQGGQLRVSTATTPSPAGVVVAFADSGIGIQPEVLPHLFEAFYSTKSQGLGMGLFVSQSIIQQHGGWIDVESQHGVGTTFTIWLPTR
jgi:PAS domain S-box-containing protein